MKLRRNDIINGSSEYYISRAFGNKNMCNNASTATLRIVTEFWEDIHCAAVLRAACLHFWYLAECFLFLDAGVKVVSRNGAIPP